jgi:hypothetical protein
MCRLLRLFTRFAFLAELANFFPHFPHGVLQIADDLGEFDDMALKLRCIAGANFRDGPIRDTAFGTKALELDPETVFKLLCLFPLPFTGQTADLRADGFDAGFLAAIGARAFDLGRFDPETVEFLPQFNFKALGFLALAFAGKATDFLTDGVDLLLAGAHHFSALAIASFRFPRLAVAFTCLGFLALAIAVTCWGLLALAVAFTGFRFVFFSFAFPILGGSGSKSEREDGEYGGRRENSGEGAGGFRFCDHG